MGCNSYSPSRILSQDLRYAGMGGLWEADGGPCAAAEFETKAETAESPW